jgi:hypothetical protein
LAANEVIEHRKKNLGNQNLTPNFVFWTKQSSTYGVKF